MMMFIVSLFLLLSLAFFFLCLTSSPSTDKDHEDGDADDQKPPTSYPVIGCLISFYKNRRQLLNWYTDLLSHSPTQSVTIQRLGARRTIVTANPSNVEYILKTNFANFPKGKPFTDILGDLLGRGIFNVDGESWSNQRKLASHEFSTKSLREFTVKTLRDLVGNRLVPLLEETAASGRVMDLQDVLRRFAFDVVCRVSLGYDPVCLDLSKPVLKLVKAFDAASEISAMRGMAPVYMIWKLKRFFNVGSERKLRESTSLVHESVLDIIKTKKRELNGDGNGGMDLLSRMLSAGLQEEVVRDMVISFVMAGRDTTSSAMTWLFWLLFQNDSVAREVVNEVESVIGDHGGALDFEGLKEMNFLKACLCESMRLYPPVPWDSKHAADDDVLPDGTPVREGDRVTYMPYGMGRMEALWGKDCLEFKPRRWLDDSTVVGGDEEKKNRVCFKSVSPFKFPVFQAGPRVCLGKEMAFIQMKYVVGSVLRRFDIKPVCADSPVFVPLLTGHMVGGLKVLVRKRT